LPCIPNFDSLPSFPVFLVHRNWVGFFIPIWGFHSGIGNSPQNSLIRAEIGVFGDFFLGGPFTMGTNPVDSNLFPF